MTQTSSRSKTPWLLGGAVIAAAAVVVLFVLPAETGYDPTGVGEAVGLTEIADPMNEEFVRGMARMENEDVLILSDGPFEPIEGIQDAWEFELAPFESVEFKYTIPEAAKMNFRWAGTGELHYDMHAHPFDGGEEVTESYGIGDATSITGTYTPAFSGIHGWFWENRSLDNVTVRLEASGGMTHSTIFAGSSVAERPLEGAEPVPEGTVAGHEMRSEAEQ